MIGQCGGESYLIDLKDLRVVGCVSLEIVGTVAETV